MLEDKKLDGQAFMKWVTKNNDDSFGEEIRDKIWQNPIRYYLSQKNKSDDEDDDVDLDSSSDKYMYGYGRYVTTFDDY
jgi:hypothetical protein